MREGTCLPSCQVVVAEGGGVVEKDESCGCKLHVQRYCRVGKRSNELSAIRKSNSLPINEATVRHV